MTEPTQEQVAAEAGRASQLAVDYFSESNVAPSKASLARFLATALARRALEARDEALEEAYQKLLHTNGFTENPLGIIRALRGAR